MSKILMVTLADSEKPRERCLHFGPSCLSVRECIAIVLGTGPPGTGCMGLASLIMARSGAGLGQDEEEKAFFSALETNGSAYLKDCPGLGPAGQARILAAFELGRRYALYRYDHSVPHENRAPPRTGGKKSQAVAGLANQALHKVSPALRIEPKEWIGFVAVYRNAKLGELCIIERGVRTHVNFDPADFFARILAPQPEGYFLFHNHPSGMTNPSLQDLELTQRIGELSLQFQIHLLGHWIVAPHSQQWIAPI